MSVQAEPGYLLDQISERTSDINLWGVDVYEIDGPYFFGIANKFDEVKEYGDY